MGDRIFPKVAEASAQGGRASYEMRCLFHERLLYRYLERKMDGWSVKDFLEAEKIETYVLYAVTDFTDFFIKDLARDREGYVQGVICDRNAGAFRMGHMGWPVITPEELLCRYQNGSVGKVIVMSVLHEKEIMEDLLGRGIRLDALISFVSVLYS